MPNDIEMLRWAGDGYAMASGHPEAIRAAGQQAPHFDDDGVAQILESKLAEPCGLRRCPDARTLATGPLARSPDSQLPVNWRSPWPPRLKAHDGSFNR